jgi:hypothetical protein
VAQATRDKQAARSRGHLTRPGGLNFPENIIPSHEKGLRNFSSAASAKSAPEFFDGLAWPFVKKHFLPVVIRINRR